jgi:hypothetical protein
MAALSYQRPSCLPPFHCSVAPCIQPQPQQPPVQQQSVQVLRVRTYVYQHRAAVASIHLLLFLKASAAQRDDYNPPSLSLSLSLSLRGCWWGYLRLLLWREAAAAAAAKRKSIRAEENRTPFPSLSRSFFLSWQHNISRWGREREKGSFPFEPSWTARSFVAPSSSTSGGGGSSQASAPITR